MRNAPRISGSPTPAARRGRKSNGTAKIVVGDDGIKRYDDGMRVNYDIPSKVNRNKYARMLEGGIVRAILIDDELAAIFPTNKSVLTALRKLARERAATTAAKPRRRKAS
jgi:hypothetical protein